MLPYGETTGKWVKHFPSIDPWKDKVLDVLIKVMFQEPMLKTIVHHWFKYDEMKLCYKLCSQGDLKQFIFETIHIHSMCLLINGNFTCFNSGGIVIIRSFAILTIHVLMYVSICLMEWQTLQQTKNPWHIEKFCECSVLISAITNRHSLRFGIWEYQSLLIILWPGEVY